MISELLFFVVIPLILYAFYKWATFYNDYFEQKNLKFIKPRFLVGSTGGIIANKYTAAEFAEKMYNTFPDEP